eukprot:1144659-Pelagomonas_calceolata.AAC.1
MAGVMYLIRKQLGLQECHGFQLADTQRAAEAPPHRLGSLNLECQLLRAAPSHRLGPLDLEC